MLSTVGAQQQLILFNQHICNRHKFHRSVSSDIFNYVSHICDRSKKVAKFLSVADLLQIVLTDSSQICHRAVVYICSISVSLVRALAPGSQRVINGVLLAV